MPHLPSSIPHLPSSMQHSYPMPYSNPSMPHTHTSTTPSHPPIPHSHLPEPIPATGMFHSAYPLGNSYFNPYLTQLPSFPAHQEMGFILGGQGMNFNPNPLGMNFQQNPLIPGMNFNPYNNGMNLNPSMIQATNAFAQINPHIQGTNSIPNIMTTDRTHPPPLM